MKKTLFFLLTGILLLGAAPPSRISIYTIGDSTMADKDTASNNPETGWGQVLSTFFKPDKVNIENHAKDGRSTKSFIEEGRWQTIVNKLKKGDYVFIQFGHNDEKADQPQLYTDPQTSYKDNLKRFVRETRAKGANPVLLTSIVRRRFDSNGTWTDTHGNYPAAVKALSRELGVPLIDLEEKTRKLVLDEGMDGSKKLFLHFKKGENAKYPEGKTDDTHLSRYGAFAVARLAVEGIRELKLPLTAVLKERNEEILFSADHNTGVFLQKGEEVLAQTALSLLQSDIQKVFGTQLHITANAADAQIIAGSVGKNGEIDRLIREKKINISKIKDKWEAFQIIPLQENGKKKLIIAGSDSRGTAYGLLEVSRIMGVSPWEWWADATPARKQLFLLPSEEVFQSPFVQFRGIFLNDEDWGLTPWSTKTYEPDAKTLYPVQGRFQGTIGPQTYEKIFQLLLRLRANSIWPAMHEVTMPFYFVEGNREMAEKYGIFIGSSHCEPLARNSATEWDLAGEGAYNYLTNKDNIVAYWSDRLKDLKSSNNIFTIGMRGKHDGPMEGVKNTGEYKRALEQILPDQQALLKKYINPDITRVPQMLIPYKEILDVYKAGLNVPDHVTLMWCDDNYGYLTHFPDEKEQLRAGGNGVYYHASYWGRPHDYLWLGTASPALLYQQMKLAYEKNARKIWILNVGDIKPLEYQMELFLDMAWNIDAVKGIAPHLQNWLNREFGETAGTSIFPVLEQHYRLAYIRKPEFLGNTREEERDPVYKTIKDLPWSERQITERLAAYEQLSLKVEEAGIVVPAFRKDTWFQLVQYPVQAATQMNNKLLYAQLARHNKAPWSKSHSALDSIITLTQMYNSQNNGKWRHMMDYQPRNLPVFKKVKEEQATQPPPADRQPLYLLNGTDFNYSGKVIQLSAGLGYEGKAIVVEKGSSIAYPLENLAGDSLLVEIHLLPGHPVSGDSLRFSITLDNSNAGEIDYRTYGRSEEWKENVLRNQAIRKVTFPVPTSQRAQLTITALDEGVVVDQVFIYKN